MIPLRIGLSNFLSYGDADVDLAGLSMVALAGENGAGKSALAVDALTWALWGLSRARSDDDLVRAGASECMVTVDIAVDRGTYRVSRRRHLGPGGRAGTSALTLEALEGGRAVKLTAETIRETQERIEGVLGLDGKTFINTACLVQGRADEFARAGPKDRKDLLAEILGIRSWQEWAGMARDRGHRAAAAAAAEQSSAEAFRQALAGAGGLRAQLQEVEARLDAQGREVSDLAGRLEGGRALAQAQSETLRMRGSLRADLAAVEGQARAGRMQISRLTEQLAAIATTKPGSRPLQCPTCGQDIVDTKAAERVEEWARRQADLRARLEADLLTVDGATDDAVIRAGEIQERLSVVEAEVDGVGDMQAALRAAESNHQTAAALLASWQADAAGIRGRLQQLAALERDLERAEGRAAEASARAADMILLDSILGPNGIQAMLIDAAIPEIVDEANRLLGILTAGTTTIDLRTQRAGKTTGRDIETLDLLISDGLGIRPYELYSGGERFRVDFATRIALSRLLARRASAPCRTLVIDEGFGSQDGRGREALMECLSMIAAEFGLILVISHVDDLREALPCTILVEKGPNGSRAILR